MTGVWLVLGVLTLSYVIEDTVKLYRWVRKR